MEDLALIAASEVVMKLDREGIINVEDCVLREDELVDWLAKIIRDVYEHIAPSDNKSVDEALEFGEGDGTNERLRDEP